MSAALHGVAGLSFLAAVGALLLGGGAILAALFFLICTTAIVGIAVVNAIDRQLGRK